MPFCPSAGLRINSVHRRCVEHQDTEYAEQIGLD
jgi:hypothetical protein